MDDLNLFAKADSSTLQYGVNIKMTNRCAESLMEREMRCWLEHQRLFMTSERENLGTEKEQKSRLIFSYH